MLEIRALSKHFGGATVLRDITLAIPAGAVIGIVGNNGAGKTTLMKCITGAETPDSGTIVFNGQALLPSNPRATHEAGIDMIYQNLSLCPQMNAVANIFLGREERRRIVGLATPFLDDKEMTAQARDILHRINATVPLNKEVRMLSGGQQQAVAIARALLSAPKLLIMDEPTASLGVAEKTRVLDLIRTLKQKGMTILLVSHQLHDVLDVADRVILLQQGTIKLDLSRDRLSYEALSGQLLV